MRLTAPAKLTWSLHVVGRRDDGLHLLEAEMVTLDLADTVELDDAAPEEAERFVVRCEPPATGADAELGDDDLVRRALRLVGRRAHVTVTKRIPQGAGLGGGSADAACVLRWAGVSDPALAVRLGADVPFCVLGGRALARGVGEVLEPLEPLDRTVTLALPALRVPTAACYDAFDACGPADRAHERNDLTVAAELVEPRLAAVRRALEADLGTALTLAGSGAAMFCEGDPLGLGTGGATRLATPVGEARVLVARTTGS